ncbi:energy-coupling factor transporter transmembrane component T family protein [Devriesea agamarum]|uniref:energy-coupling factor transporter transmembrane component T family protein n=1 Tax=Devriesea agamarum TaxID=472569 RepID=UPI00071CAB09|nr:energy-coupling factor transporter transmembrane component T [Devriesea agamarum]
MNTRSTSADPDPQAPIPAAASTNAPRTGGPDHNDPLRLALARWHPVTPAVAALSGACAAFAPGPWWVPLPFLGGALIVAMRTRHLRAVFATLVILTGPVMVMLTLIQGFTYPEARTVLAHLGPIRLNVEGLLLAAGLSSRLATASACLILAGLCTRPADLFAGMRSIGFPPRFALLTATTMGLIPQYRERLTAIRQARIARGLLPPGKVRLIGRLRSLPSLAAPLLVGAVLDLDQRVDALIARGVVPPPGTRSQAEGALSRSFSRVITLRPYPIRRRDRIVMWGTALFACLWLALWLIMTSLSGGS